MELIPKKLIKPLAVLFFTGIGSAVVIALGNGDNRLIKLNDKQSRNTSPTTIDKIANKNSGIVSVLGYLRPEGDIVELSPPLQNLNGGPVVSKLYVEEGDEVKAGEILMDFNSLELVNADISILNALIDSIAEEMKLLQSETKRYRSLVDHDAYPYSELERRQQIIIRLKSKLRQNKSELNKALIKHKYSSLSSPANGVIIRINTLEGEKASPKGLIEMSRSLGMEAILQVDEFNIDQIKREQNVEMTSENGSFSGSLKGKVSYIANRVGKRRRYTLDPSFDSDVEERIFEVHVKIDNNKLPIIRKLIGAKVVARIATR